MSDDGFRGFVHHFDLEGELYTAMAEETDGLGSPELDMERVHGAGRRRRMVLAGGGAAAALVGVTAVAVVVGGGSGGSGSSGGSGKTAAAAGSASTAGRDLSGNPSPMASGPGGKTSSGGQPCDHMPLVVPPSSGRYMFTEDPATPSSEPPAYVRLLHDDGTGGCAFTVVVSPFNKSPYPLNFTVGPPQPTGSSSTTTH